MAWVVWAACTKNTAPKQDLQIKKPDELVIARQAFLLFSNLCKEDPNNELISAR